MEAFRLDERSSGTAVKKLIRWLDADIGSDQAAVELSQMCGYHHLMDGRLRSGIRSEY